MVSDLMKAPKNVQSFKNFWGILTQLERYANAWNRGKQWRSSHLPVLALRQGRQNARGRQNEASHCKQQAKIKKKVKQENDLERGI